MTQPLNPWYIPGWTIQNPTTVFPPADPTPIFLPDDILVVTITAKYASIDSYSMSGSVKFTKIGTTLDTVSDTLILPAAPIVGLIVGGQLTVNVPAGFTYKVREFLPGGRTFTITIPSNASGTISINTLIVPDSSI